MSSEQWCIIFISDKTEHVCIIQRGKKNESDIYESYIAFDETYVYDNTRKGLDIT